MSTSRLENELEKHNNVNKAACSPAGEEGGCQ